ncbi:MAG: MurR/RpiR family transcriptional regulator [Pseudomonadota bacterium]
MPPASAPNVPASPETLGELRALLAQEQEQGKSSTHGKRAIKVLAGLLDAPRETAMYSITHLAEQHGVHASTLTRLAKNLGYSGFSEFQAVFRQHLSSTGHFYSQQADQLLHPANEEMEANASGRLVARVCGTEIDNIQRMRHDLDFDQMAAAAKLLTSAKRVRTHGLRQSFAIAVYLSYVLGLLRNDVAVLGSFEHGIAHSLAQLDDADALLVVGFAPYTRRTVQAAEIAARHGLPIVALNDSHASPLSTVARHSFIAPATGAFISNSVGAAFVLAESIVSMVAQVLGDESIAALERREKFIEEEKIEV